VVQPDRDLALAFSISWDDQQGRDACFSKGEKKRKDHFNANEFSSGWKYIMDNQLAR
jgi:hypothetical protein